MLLIAIILFLGICYAFYYKANESKLKTISEDVITFCKMSQVIPNELKTESADSENIAILKEEINNKLLEYYISENSDYIANCSTINDYIDLQLDGYEQINDSIVVDVEEYSNIMINFEMAHLDMIVSVTREQGGVFTTTKSKYKLGFEKNEKKWKITSIVYDGPIVD